MYIEIDDKSGFCFGVVKAITKAEESLAELGKVFSLGDIVHNRVEVQRLEKLGLETIAHSHFPELDGQTVLIRAHGEPPTTYALAAAHRIRLIDATCPVVARLQTLVKKAHEQMSGCNGQVVILGKRGHAEVVGLTGQVDGMRSSSKRSTTWTTSISRDPFTCCRKPRRALPCSKRCTEPSWNAPPTVAGDRQRYDLPAGFEPEPAPKRVRPAVRRRNLRLRPEKFERESAVSNLYGSQSALLQHRGRTRTAKRVVRRLPIGRHLRRDIHPEMADAASRRHDP